MTHYNLKKSIGKKLVKHECETQKANDESNTVESPKKGHFGTNINSSGLSNRDCPLLRDSNCIILIGGLKFGDLVLSIVERYLIQCPVKRDSTVVVIDSMSHSKTFLFLRIHCIIGFRCQYAHNF